MFRLVEDEVTGKGKKLTGCVKRDNIVFQIVFKKNGFVEIEEGEHYSYCKIIESKIDE